MEKVNTGGTISFNYPKGYQPKITEEERRGIEEAYEKVDERKKRERKRNLIITLIVLLVCVLGSIFIPIFLLK